MNDSVSFPAELIHTMSEHVVPIDKISGLPSSPTILKPDKMIPVPIGTFLTDESLQLVGGDHATLSSAIRDLDDILFKSEGVVPYSKLLKTDNDLLLPSFTVITKGDSEPRDSDIIILIHNNSPVDLVTSQLKESYLDYKISAAIKIKDIPALHREMEEIIEPEGIKYALTLPIEQLDSKVKDQVVRYRSLEQYAKVIEILRNPKNFKKTVDSKSS